MLHNNTKGGKTHKETTQKSPKKPQKHSKDRILFYGNFNMSQCLGIMMENSELWK